MAIEKEVGPGGTGAGGSGGLKAEIEVGAAGAEGWNDGAAGGGGNAVDGRSPVEDIMGFATVKEGAGAALAIGNLVAAAAAAAALAFFAQASTAGARCAGAASPLPAAGAIDFAAANGFSVEATALDTAFAGDSAARFTASAAAFDPAFRRIIYIARAISARKPSALATELPATTAVDALPAADLLSPAARPTGPRAERSADRRLPRPTGCALPDAVALSRADADACSVPRALRDPAGEAVDTPVLDARAL